MTTTNTENRGADLATIRAIAEAVPDPELVVVNVGDLGIIREVRVGENGFEIDVTPTYSACPATLAIELAIETAVSAQGHPVRVRRVLSPAWTTDWISSEGRAKLKASGIAPPALRGQKDDSAGGDDAGYFNRPKVACPHCDSMNTSELSGFGSTACKAQYRCEHCLEPFDYFKCL
ncbi:MAG: phenylacetate-CoA oxygenase subunit PaaJ [Bacteroidetes bacterium]|nr:phenylacetate-CoA oxygenase subunit PaaJ [Bacteroidota bacterium]